MTSSTVPPRIRQRRRDREGHRPQKEAIARKAVRLRTFGKGKSDDGNKQSKGNHDHVLGAPGRGGAANT